MDALDELMEFVRQVSLMRRAQRRYATRQMNTSLAEVRKLEHLVDEQVTHLLNAPIPFPAAIADQVEQPAADVVQVEQPAADVVQVEQPAADVVQVEQPAADVVQVEQPAADVVQVEQPAADEQPRRGRRGRGHQSTDPK